MTDSCFLPNTRLQYALDSTSIGAFKRCPRYYQYIILEGWQSRTESIHLRFGIEVHAAIQAYDVSRANGVKHEDAIHDTVRSILASTADWVVDRNTKIGRYKNRVTLVLLVVDYLDAYGLNDPATTVIKADGTPAVELSFRFELDWGPKIARLGEFTNEFSGQILETATEQPYLLCGHLDRVVEFNGARMVMDYKSTTRQLTEFYFDQYEPDNQMSLYTLAGGIILDSPIKGVIINGMRILLEQPNEFQRGFTYRTPDQLDEWLDDLRITTQMMEAYAEANYWPMNDTACDKYGGCPFRAICSKSPQVRSNFLKADFVQLPEAERWNPLKTR